MNDRRSISRRLAVWAAQRTVTGLSEDGHDWRSALVSELDYIRDDREALGWAFSGLYWLYRARFRQQTQQVSRWIVCLEMLLCFLPATLLTLAVISALAIGSLSISEGTLLVSSAAIGPLGLLATFAIAVMRWPGISSGLSWCLRAGAVWAILSFSLSTFWLAGPVAIWARDFVMLGLLPAVGAAHLLLLVDRTSDFSDDDCAL